MKIRLIVLLIAGFARNANAQAQYVSFRIDSAVRADMEARQIPGMQIAVIKYGVVIKKGHYGYANLEDRLPVTDSTLFAIASMSQSMTCAGILLLMEEGKLSLEDSIGKYLDSLPASWAPITIRQLMNHTAGLRDDWDEGDEFFYTRNNDSTLFSALKSYPLKFKPGTAFSYGCGPFVLGLLISKVSGENYADFMQRRIFDKLGMKNTRINDAEGIIPNRAAGYCLKDDKIVHGRAISAASQARGDVGVLSTVTDMLKWYAALQDSSLLHKSSLDMMFAPGILTDSSKTAYGFGWFVNPYRDHPLFSHRGSFRTGYNSYIEIYPEDGVCIVLLSNLYNAHTYQIAKDIIGLFDKDYARASQMDSVADPDTVRTLLLKSYFTEMGLNVTNSNKLAASIHLPVYFMKDEELGMFRNVEDFTFIKTIRPSKPAPDIFGDTIQGIYLYKVKCKNQPLRYFAFLLNPAGKLVYLDYEE